MQKVKYKRSIKELLDDENEDLDLIVTFSCKDGNTLEYLFFSDKEMAVKKAVNLPTTVFQKSLPKFRMMRR